MHGDNKQPAANPPPTIRGAFDNELRTLARLRDDGVITEDDFGRKKKEILDKLVPSANPPPVNRELSIAQPPPLQRRTSKRTWTKEELAGVILVVVLVIASYFCNREFFQSSVVSSEDSTGAPPQQDTAKKPTKHAWKAKLAAKSQIFAVARSLQMRKTDFLDLMGKPDRTETIGDDAFWYYDCSDGTIQIECNAVSANTVGFLQGKINDY